MSGTKSTTFFWSDWMSDPGLRACEPASRGIWMDMLCIAAQHEGYVSIAGRSLGPEDISRLVGAPVAEVQRGLADLEKNGVFSRNRTGVIYCRRMIKAEKNRKNGKLGGNPNFKKTKEKPNPVEQEPKPHRPSPIPVPELKEESLALSGGGSGPLDGWPSDAWERFWKTYPHKVGKADAQKAFTRVRRQRIVEWDEFWSGLGRYVRKTDDRPWCNPATWINQHRWSDQPAPNGRSQSSPQRGSNGFAQNIISRMQETTEGDEQ